MGLDVATVTMRFLDRPSGAAYDFAYMLADESPVWGAGNAFGFYLKNELQQAATAYIEQERISPIGQREIFDWIESLPFRAEDYIALHFNW